MRDHSRTGQEKLSPDMARLLDRVCDEFEAAWQVGKRPQIEDYFAEIPESLRGAVLRELLPIELNYRAQHGEQLIEEEYQRRFPDHAESIAFVFREGLSVTSPSRGVGDQLPPPEPERVPPLKCANPVGSPSTGADATRTGDEGPHRPPTNLGRYQIKIKLGSGGFGVVYKAYDTELRREVAVKVPRRHGHHLPGSAEAFLTEARILAGLDHPGIVPVYDVAHTEDGQCYVVSKFVEGMDLRTRIKQGRPSMTECVELVARVALALHYAHQHGLVHRDIKPSNILLDTRGNPFVADFGLALREEDFGRGPADAGTPVYMSPEQARGEGHLVDARTDVYSLGLVFYELLTGQRPFRAKNRSDLLDQINTHEVRPPRQLDDTIPKELDRVCLKALSKRVSDRYSTALDLAEDLRHWQAGQLEKPAMNLQVLIPSAAAIPASSAPVVPAPPDSAAKASSISDKLPIRVIPKGLRSFDAEDADYFLDLLPGPRGRDGLPDSIRFWKYRLEETNSDKTFRVGLIYGPSGCGKSSFVKAGLLPRLAEHVVTIYVEATPAETETKLLKSLGKRFSGLPTSSGLTAALTCLRKGQHLAAATKVLIVLDQFEQWLHAMQDKPNLELVQALRQCDGQHLQCIVLVRDDFWMAITSFMKELEVPLLENQNSAAVDLFSPRHARKVLLAFGKAFDAVAELGPTPEQERFLDQAVAGLTQNGKIIPVHLALFAEMVKGKPWTTSTLKEVGGTEGIGVAFLEETFSSTAPPPHRLHQKAARAVLQALLPEPGASLKGQMKSHQDLLEASGYSHKPREFDELLHILDTELRLVTPTPGDESDFRSLEDFGSLHHWAEDAPSTAKYYQLTHDYLVPSLQQWLVRKQQETFRGRAELRLAEWTALWSVKPERRLVPSLWEWVNILLLTRKRRWTAPERRMMTAASVGHGIRGSIFILVILILSLLVMAWRTQETSHARGLVSRLLVADIVKVPDIIDELKPYRRWTDPELVRILNKADSLPKERLRASLALLPVDEGQAGYLSLCLLNAEPDDLFVIRKQMEPLRDKVVPPMWQRLQDAGTDPSQRLRLACALAAYDPNNESWPAVAKDTADHLVKEDLLLSKQWTDGLRPIRRFLLGPLTAIFQGGRPERYVATSILADYAADDPQRLADLVKEADVRQYAELIDKLSVHRLRVVIAMKEELTRIPSSNVPEQERDRLARRHANAAITLYRLGEYEAIWPVFQHSADPSARTYLIHDLNPFGADPGPLVQRWLENREKAVSAQRALILSLGEFGDRLPMDDRPRLVAKLLDAYGNDPDAGIHSAAEWLLRKWGEDKQLQRVDEEVLGKRPESGNSWYINREGHTMVPLDPQDAPTALSHGQKINGRFAIATKEVTVKQYLRLVPNHEYFQKYSPQPDCPVNDVTWFDAARYCNLLSENEGIHKDQWCYERSSTGHYAEGMKAKSNYLQLTGYRLPTEAEWEYACRAQATTSRYFGNCDELVGKYCWFVDNANERLWPGGRLKPNDFGLFDMLGNVFEWCQDPNPQAKADKEDSGLIRHSVERAVRGGAIRYRAKDLRSELENYEMPTVVWKNMGFRVARSVGPGK